MMSPLRPLVLLLAATLHAAPVAAVSVTATQTPSAPATAAATASPTGSYRPGIITTLAGTGVASYGGDGGPATSAGLWYPRGLAFDQGGNLLISDVVNHRIRRVLAGTGIIATLAGNGMASLVTAALR